MRRNFLSGRIAETAAGLIALVVAGGFIWQLQRSPAGVASEPDTSATPAQSGSAAGSGSAASGARASGDAGVADTGSTDIGNTGTGAPSFDTVRVTPAGEALVAGRARPGSEIVLSLDGTETSRVTANERGEFVAIFEIPRAASAQMLSLSETPAGAGAQPVAGLETVAISPFAETGQAGDPPAPPATLLISESGARLMRPADLAPGSVTIASITYTPDGAVQLSGFGDRATGVRIYLDSQLADEVATDSAGAWFSTLRMVAPGLYMLRADQIDAGGKVLARFETPFRRETPEALAAVLKPGAATLAPGPGGRVTPAGGDALPRDMAPAGALSGGPLSVTVQPGFTLWRIARETLGDGVLYVKVFEANRAQIRDPDLIYPGQVFAVPKVAN